MSVRHALLGLLERGPRYGYQLRTEFEERTASAWPLNVGQVYTTLQRLERDGLVAGTGLDQEGRPVYEVTDTGRDVVAEWFAVPVDRAQPPRDELVIKLAVALALPDVEVADVVQTQRTATMTAMQGYVRLRRRTSDVAESLVLDSLIFAAEAELRWLDHCEQLTQDQEETR